MRKSWVVFFLFDRSLLTLGLILQSEFIISSKNWQIGSIGVWGWPSYRQMERGVAWSTQAWNPSLYIISSAHTRARCHAACDDARVCIRLDAVKTALLHRLSPMPGQQENGSQGGPSRWPARRLSSLLAVQFLISSYSSITVCCMKFLSYPNLCFYRW